VSPYGHRVQESSEPGELSVRVSAEVRAWMARKGIRQDDLAHQMGLSQQALSSRLTGRTRWTVDDLAVAAAALQVPISSLLSFPDGP
jgi:transcriptional regulator with XRE-family HTH domain